MAIKKINTDLQIEAGLLDNDGNSGSANQVLVSTSTGVDWVDGSGSGIIGGPYLPLSAGSSYPLTGKLYVGQGIEFTGGSIAQATAVLHTNNIVYFRGGSSGLFLQNADGSDGIYISKSYKVNKSFILNDSIIYKLNNLSIRRTFNPINTTFKELVSTGNIDLLRNKKLKRNITKLYNELDRVSLVTLNNNTNLIDGLYNPVLVKNIPYVFRFNGKKAQIF